MNTIVNMKIIYQYFISIDHRQIITFLQFLSMEEKFYLSQNCIKDVSNIIVQISYLKINCILPNSHNYNVVKLYQKSRFQLNC
jgi:hypothetical protein